MIRTATGILAALVLIAAPASAEWVVASGPAGHGTVNVNDDPISITLNSDPTIIDNMVACGSNTVPPCTTTDGLICTTENQWGRLYNLDAAHSINEPFAVQSVDVGHLFATHNLGESITVDINLYELAAGDAVTYANLSVIGSSSVQVPGDGSAAGTFENIPVNGTIDPSTSDLFVEHVAPTDGTVEPFQAYRAGGNGAGEFGPSYLASVSCGVPDPVTFASIGFGTIHLVQVVNGKVDDGTIPTESVSWSEIKSLY